MVKKKEPPYAIMYAISVIIALGIDFLFLNRLNLHSTIHVALAFLVLTISISILVYSLEKR
ncbi:MAG: hypothetical protein IIA85_00640 [Nanoarchaeota archaeon]|nr:hypothetical protein [Nanoarchaeota archaeon]